jgi:hypothetical protein
MGQKGMTADTEGLVMGRFVKILIFVGAAFAALFFLQGRVGERPQVPVEKGVSNDALR